MTYRQLQRAVAGLLEGHGLPDPERDALFLLQLVTGTDLTHYLLRAGDEAGEETVRKCMELAGIRAEHVPLQHIAGSAPFKGRDFKVNDRVLIPRPDTEVAAMEAIRILEEEFPEGSVLDLCTGSGILAVTLALEVPGVRVQASDISTEALEVAAQNARRLGAEVIFREGDLFEAAGGTFDLIVTNPPYIPTKTIRTLDREVRDHDPLLALDGGEDGFRVISRILREAPAHLSKDGWLVVEIGHDQGERIVSGLAAGGWREINLLKDLAGHDRAASARRPLTSDIKESD